MTATTSLVSDAILTEIIDALPTEFDSHSVIHAIMRQYPQEYVSDLYGHVASQDPILTFHATIGTRLAGVATIERTARTNSLNVRGETTENQGWRKR